ncbi:MAG TPA: hypothetical protein VGM10_13585 [Actinocrinis sp.]|jgi:hypothetical protein
MRARTAALLLGAVLVFYLAGCLWEGVKALHDGFLYGSAISGLLGTVLLMIGGAGAWFLVREIRLGFAAERMATALADEGALGQGVLDALPRSPGGRVERAAADELFAKRRAEAEAAPKDWRTWYRLAAAYAAAKEGSRSRAAMRRAIKLWGSPGGRGRGSGSPD